MHCLGVEFTEPCLPELILKSTSNVWQSLESPTSELSKWAGQFFRHIVTALFIDSAQTKSGLNLRRSVSFMWTADEWNLFRLAEIVVAISALLKAKAIDEWYTFHGYGGVKLTAWWLNPRKFNIRETQTSQSKLTPVVGMNLFRENSDASAE